MRTFRIAALSAAMLGIAGCVNHGDLTGSRSAEQDLAASCRHWDALAASGADAEAASIAKECWEDLAIGRQQDEEMQQNLARDAMKSAGESLKATGEDMQATADRFGATAAEIGATPLPRPPDIGPPVDLLHFYDVPGIHPEPPGYCATTLLGQTMACPH